MKYVMAILMLLILVVGCAPSGNTATSQPQTPVTFDNKSTQVPPIAAQPSDNKSTQLAPETTTPPAQAPVAKALSFEAETYTNDAFGFTWQYPRKWVKAPLSGDVVITVISSNDMSPDGAGVMVVPEAADFSKAVKAGYEALPKVSVWHVKVDASPSKDITLADGKTSASESIVTANIQGYDVYGYAVGFNKGGKTIIAWGTTLGGDNNKALVKEIAQTLAVK